MKVQDHVTVMEHGIAGSFHSCVVSMVRRHGCFGLGASCSLQTEVVALVASLASRSPHTVRT